MAGTSAVAATSEAVDTSEVAGTSEAVATSVAVDTSEVAGTLEAVATSVAVPTSADTSEAATSVVATSVVAADRISAPDRSAADRPSRGLRRDQASGVNARLRVAALQTEPLAAGRRRQVEPPLSAGKSPTTTAAQTSQT